MNWENLKVEHELSSAGFLVCQDIFPTETTRFAHVVLPAAAWSENDGTFSNSERRVSRVRAASDPPGQAKPNWLTNPAFDPFTLTAE